MKERPILFSAPMIRALLDGRKTQTRRVAKVTDEWCKPGFISPLAGHTPRSLAEHASYCPHGQPGDLLWARERADYFDRGDGIGYVPMMRYHADGHERRIPLEYENTFERPVRRNSIHMWRWASRITIQLTEVRVERLQDISEADAIAEGIERIGGQTSSNPWKDYSREQRFKFFSAPSASYRTLWESINGVGSWDANPWVWVLEFLSGKQPLQLQTK